MKKLLFTYTHNIMDPTMTPLNQQSIIASIQYDLFYDEESGTYTVEVGTTAVLQVMITGEDKVAIMPTPPPEPKYHLTVAILSHVNLLT